MPTDQSPLHSAFAPENQGDPGPMRPSYAAPDRGVPISPLSDPRSTPESEPMAALMRAALNAASPHVESLRRRGWDATMEVSQIGSSRSAVRVSIHIDVDSPRIPIETIT